jgi:hypothetical protein
MMRSFLTIICLLVVTSSLVSAGTSSGWNVDKSISKVSRTNGSSSVASISTDIQKRGDEVRRRAQEKSKELKLMARTIRKSARTKASDLLAQVKDKSSDVQASTKKRADSLIAKAKKDAKELEEKAKKLLADA